MERDLEPCGSSTTEIQGGYLSAKPNRNPSSSIMKSSKKQTIMHSTTGSSYDHVDPDHGAQSDLVDPDHVDPDVVDQGTRGKTDRDIVDLDGDPEHPFHGPAEDEEKHGSNNEQQLTSSANSAMIASEANSSKPLRSEQTEVNSDTDKSSCHELIGSPGYASRPKREHMTGCESMA